MADFWDEIKSAWDSFSDLIVSGWHSVLDEVFEPLFNALGFEDEIFLEVQKVSYLVYTDPAEDPVQDAQDRAAISMMKVGGSYHDWHLAAINKTHFSVLQYFRYAELGGYSHGLPEAIVTAGNINSQYVQDAVITAIQNTEITIISTTLGRISDEIYFKIVMQEAPYNMVTWDNTLTFDDPWDVSRSDFQFDTVTYDNPSGQYSINISRTAPDAVFWLEGQTTVVRGNVAIYTLHCNRTVPVGTYVMAKLVYTGTELSRRYREVRYVTLSAGLSEITFGVVVDPSNGSLPNLNIVVTIDEIINVQESFESVSIHGTDTVTTLTTDNSGATIGQSPTANPAVANATVTRAIIKPRFLESSYILTQYHEDVNPPGEWFYHASLLALDVSPVITYETYNDNMMLPVVILKNSTGSLTEEKDGEEYSSGKAMLKMLGLRIDDIIAGLEENVDYDSIQDIYVNFGLSPNDTAEFSSKALWLMFYEIVVTQALYTIREKYSISINEQAIKNSIGWTGHTYEADIVGVLASGQVYEHEVTSTERTYYETPSGYMAVLEREADWLTIRYQATPTTYNELIIKNLASLSTIKKDGLVAIATNTILDDGFTLPVSYTLFDRLSRTEQLEIYQYTLRIDMYAAQVVHIRWYQTENFMVLFKVVTTVLTIVSFGALSWLEILINIAFFALVTELVLYIAEETGNENLAAFAGVLAVVGASYGFGLPVDLTEAETLLRLSTNFADNLTAAYDFTTSEMQQEIDILAEQVEVRLEENAELAGNKLYDGAISTEFLVALSNIDEIMFPAIDAQYDFDLVFNYDSLIADVYELQYRIGVN